MSTSDEDGEASIFHAEFDTARTEPAMAVVETVADIENRSVTDLPAIYECIDHVVDHLFSTPPHDEAQVEVSFSYEGYRVTVCQDGDAKFRRSAG